jgi:putative hydrolase of the HAD superfamily
MIETAIEITNGTIQGHELEAIIDYTKDTLSADVQLIPGAEQTVSELSGEYKLIMITKGDLFEQDRKIKLSGLADYFEHIEFVSDKSSAGYLGLLEKHRIKPREFLMVGNSLRSDILPVVAVGAQAVYIPYPDTWEHENTIEESIDETSFYRIETIDQLPVLIRHLEKS